MRNLKFDSIAPKLRLAFLLEVLARSLSPLHASPLDIEGRGHNPGSNVLFYSFDQTGEEKYGTWGAKSSPTEHLGISGPRIFTTFGSKLGEYNPFTRQSHHRLDQNRAMLGYEWIVPDVSVTFVAGFSTMLYPALTQLQTGMRGRPGLAAMLEMWRSTPFNTPFGLSALSATLLIDSSNQSLYARLRPYFHLPIPALAKSGIQIGPEVSFSVSNTLSQRGLFSPDVIVQTGWTKLRIGGHISEIPLLKARMSLSTGLEILEDGKKKFYGNITTYVRF